MSPIDIIEIKPMNLLNSFHFSVNAKRIILRKGHPGICFYFIYSGSTFVNVEDKNSEGEVFTKTAAILHSGESFGVCHISESSDIFNNRMYPTG